MSLQKKFCCPFMTGCITLTAFRTCKTLINRNKFFAVFSVMSLSNFQCLQNKTNDDEMSPVAL